MVEEVPEANKPISTYQAQLQALLPPEEKKSDRKFACRKCRNVLF